MRALFLIAVTVFCSLPAMAEMVSSSQDVGNCKQYKLCIHISKRTQRMVVWMNYGDGAFAIGSGTSFEEGGLEGERGARISTARGGKGPTPVGTFKVEEIAHSNRTSSLYTGAALYYAMQIQGNIFVHATSSRNYRHLGSRASAGCIRTTLDVAELLNSLMLEIAANADGDRSISAEESAMAGPLLGRGRVLAERGRDQIRVVVTSH